MTARIHVPWRTTAMILAVLTLIGVPAGALSITDMQTLDWYEPPPAGDPWRVGLAMDGNTAVRGEVFGDGLVPDSGVVYVYTNSGGVWVQQAVLMASDGAAGDEFGGTVAIDGDTIVVGASAREDFGWKSGTAYVFVRSGSVWTQQARLTPSDPGYLQQFGWSVAIDGDTILVGAQQATTPIGSETGAAYAFVRSGTTWIEQARFVPAEAEFWDQIGVSVAVEGDIAIVGALRDNDIVTDGGAAYVYTRSGSIWTQQAKLHPSDPVTTLFGREVEIDGSTVIISAWGAAYVFVSSGSVWVEQARLVGSGTVRLENAGISVGISGDRAIVGASKDDGIGSVSIFSRSGTVWTEELKIMSPDPVPDAGFGREAELDGSWAGVAAPYVNGGAGATYMLQVGDAPPDADDDGIPDALDPDVVADVVISIDAGSFAAPGHSTAIQSRLEEVEAMILDGDYEQAIEQLENLLRRLDGCPAAPTLGERADRNDWITDCDDQRAIREAIQDLIDALVAASGP